MNIIHNLEKGSTSTTTYFANYVLLYVLLCCYVRVILFYMFSRAAQGSTSTTQHMKEHKANITERQHIRYYIT